MLGISRPVDVSRRGFVASGRLTVLVIAVLLVAAVLAVTGESWIPATPVEVVRVQALRHDNQKQSTIEPAALNQHVAFQAAGWIEADPYFVRATSRIVGIVESVSVFEAEWVEKGQELARLDPADFELALQEAEAELQAQRALLMSAQAAERQSLAQLEQAEAGAAVNEAQLANARDQLERFQNASRAVSERMIADAQLQVHAKEAELEAALAAIETQKARQETMQAHTAVAKAAVAKAEVAQAQAQLNRERCIIVSPMSGMVQHVYMVPGDKVMLNMDHEASATICDIYDPQKLQVRVDVPLADAAGLFIGQQARITSSVTGAQEWQGEVLRMEGHADLARNTLQAKVRIHNPSAIMRPDMLARVQFLSASSKQGVQISESNAAGSALRLIVPTHIVQHAQENRVQVWVVDEHHKARQRELQLGAPMDGYRIIQSGVSAGAWIIVNPPAGLQEGQRVRVQVQEGAVG